MAIVTILAGQPGRLACFVGLGALLLGAQAVAGPSGERRDGMTIETLKSVYLDCAARATRQRQDTGDVMLCSIAYEELKRRAFGGDFSRLRAWEDRQRQIGSRQNDSRQRFPARNDPGAPRPRDLLA